MTTTHGLEADTAQAQEADRVLKANHRAVWAGGDYATVAKEVIPSFGPRLVEASRIRPGQRVLDVAAGSGNASIPAALAGAAVVASDLTPELFDAGRLDAIEAGVEIDWCEADAEALPFDAETFDAVISSVGVMFAPHHQRAADELVRVCRAGGTIGLISWTPEGFIGQFFAALKPFAPPPPAGAQPAPLWGDEAHVRRLLGDRVEAVEAVRECLPVANFPAPGDFRRYFKQNYGPLGALYRYVGDDDTRTAELDDAIDALAARFTREDGSGVMDWEYLLLTARKV